MYLQLKVMLSIVCLNSHLAHSHIGPTFSERSLPTDDARGGRAILLRTVMVHGRGAQIIFLRVLAHCAVG